MSEVVLRLSNVTLGYGYRPAIHHVSGEVKKGCLVGLMGPNGGGKTTLLKGIKGELQVSGGEIWSCYGRGEIGFLPQKPEIRRDFPVSVRDMVGGGALRHLGFWRGSDGGTEKKIEEALSAMCLEDVGEDDLVSLSEGQLRRALIARMVVGDYPLSVWDEPFEYLDVLGYEALESYLRKEKRRGHTVVLSLHDVDFAKRLVDEVVVVARELVAWGLPSEVLEGERWEALRHYQVKRDRVPAWCERE